MACANYHNIMPFFCELLVSSNWTMELVLGEIEFPTIKRIPGQSSTHTEEWPGMCSSASSYLQSYGPVAVHQVAAHQGIGK